MKTKLSPQNRELVGYLSTHKHITQLEAIGLFRIFRLAARIMELRDLGYRIKSERTKDCTGKSYVRYSFA